jgi:hypothetical protein
MISEGFTGLKSGKGGFYREDQALDLTSGTLRPRITELPALAQKAATAQQDGLETLPMMIEGAEPHHQYCRNFLRPRAGLCGRFDTGCHRHAARH